MRAAVGEVDGVIWPQAAHGDGEGRQRPISATGCTNRKREPTECAWRNMDHKSTLKIFAKFVDVAKVRHGECGSTFVPIRTKTIVVSHYYF
jgi:hypothetical protein